MDDTKKCLEVVSYYIYICCFVPCTECFFRSVTMFSGLTPVIFIRFYIPDMIWNPEKLFFTDCDYMS